ncbi:MAG: hypothetical protein LBE82_13230 [Chitinophagaceae bacterium]|jgi:hypothetical protein|nr:hypothetical protein [Chitinophagaceae bacterium]
MKNNKKPKTDVCQVIFKKVGFTAGASVPPVPNKSMRIVSKSMRIDFYLQNIHTNNSDTE